MDNDIIFKTRPYLDFNYNNIFFTQYQEDLPNAGYPKVGDALFEIRSRENLLDLDLSTKSLFSIANWDPSNKYKKDDLVRYKGSFTSKPQFQGGMAKDFMNIMAVECGSS